MQVSVIICLFTKIACVCQLSGSLQTVFELRYALLIVITHTADKNGVHLKIATFSYIKLNY